eukprot:gb/GECG01007473.1/.p1 GENE.gb/GECG01007473.1/~~gb/GECG01007473.1/.p1  ORF type:complete len:1593 (+),score=159.42 gb/GECG01007473.1/:1-4779(+)
MAYLRTLTTFLVALGCLVASSRATGQPKKAPIVHKQTLNLGPEKTSEWIVPMPKAFGKTLKERRTKSLLQIPRIQWYSPDKLHSNAITLCVKPVHPEHPRTKLYPTNSTCQLVMVGETFAPSGPILGLLKKSSSVKVEATSRSKMTAFLQVVFHTAPMGERSFERKEKGNHATAFDEKATVDASPILTLQDGIPQTAEVAHQKYRNYQFQPTGPQPQQDPLLQIYLTSLSGDADLVTSLVTHYPTFDNYTWGSFAIDGDDSILISSGDTKFTWGKTIYIGVYGYDQSRYSIEVSTSNINASTLLPLGQEEWQTVATASLAYFRMPNFTSWGPQGNLVIELSPITGSSNIYVAKTAGGSGSTFNYPRVIKHATKGTYIVDPSTYDMSGVVSPDGLERRIKIPPITATTNFMIAVFGDGYNVDRNGFIISAYLEGTKNSSVIPLNFNIHREDYVAASSYVYYSLTIVENKVDVAVQTVADTFLSMYATFDNSFNSWNYSAFTGFDGVGNLYISYNALSSGCQRNLSQGHDCVLLVGVTSPSGGDYSIEASYSNSSANPFPLPTTEVHTGALHHGHYDFFGGTLDLSKNETIHINLLSYLGDADLYVTLGKHPNGFGRYYYNYSSRAVDSEIDSLSIYSDDMIRQEECPCPPKQIKCICEVRVSVYDYDKTLTIYGLLVETNDTITALPNDGRTLPGTAQSGDVEYYRVNMDAFSVFNPKDLDIEVTIDSGAVQLLAVIDDGSAPPSLPIPGNAGTYNWSTPADSGSVILRIAHNDTKACHAKLFSTSCSYIVAVHSTNFADAVFSISAVVRTPGPKPDPRPTVEQLLNGRPMPAEVSADSWEYFYFQWTDLNVTSKEVDIFWYVSSGPGINVSFSNVWNDVNASSRYLPPQAICFNAASDTNFIWFTSSSPCYNGSNTIYAIGVQGLSTPGENDDAEDITRFTLIARTSDKAEDLVPGQQSPQISVPNKVMTYFTFPYNDLVSVIIETTVIQGQVFVYINNDYNSWPTCSDSGQTCDNFVWSNTMHPGEPIYINSTKPCAIPPARNDHKNCGNDVLSTPARWIVGVLGFSSSSKNIFSLTYNEGSSSDHLGDGVPLFSQTRIQPVCKQRNSVGVCTGNKEDIYKRPVAFFNFPSNQQTGALPQFQISVAKMNCTSQCPNLRVTVNSCGNGNLCTDEDEYPLSTVYGGNPSFEFVVDGPASSVFTPQEYLSCGGVPCSFYIAVYSEKPDTLHDPTSDFRIIVSTDRSITFVGWAEDNKSLEPQGIIAQNPSALNVFEVIGPSTGSVTVNLNASACRAIPQIYVCYKSTSEQRCHHGETSPGHSNYVVKSTFDYSTSTASVPPFTLSSGSMYISVLPRSPEGTSPLAASQARAGMKALGSVYALLEVSFGNPTMLQKPTSPLSVHVFGTSGKHTVTVKWNKVTFTNSQPAPVLYRAYLALQADVNAVSNYHLNTSCGFRGAWDAKLNSTGYSSVNTTKTLVTLSNIKPNKYVVFVLAYCSGKCMQEDNEQLTIFPSMNLIISKGGNPIPHHGGTDDGSHVNGGAVAGGIIGTIMGVGLIVAAVVYYKKQRAQTQMPGDDFTSSAYEQILDNNNAHL